MTFGYDRPYRDIPKIYQAFAILIGWVPIWLLVKIYAEISSLGSERIAQHFYPIRVAGILGLFAVTLLLTVAFIHQSWSTRFLRWQYSLEGDELQVYDLMKRGRACLHLKDISAIDDFNIVIKRGLSIRGHVLRTTQGVEIQLSDELTSWQEILSKYQECQNKRV